MTSETSVVTPDRFATGLSSFSAWMDSIEGRNEEFQRHYDEYEPDADDIAAVASLVESRGVKALVLGEHWCPDVWRGLPVIAKIAEGAGMEDAPLLPRPEQRHHVRVPQGRRVRVDPHDRLL